MNRTSAIFNHAPQRWSECGRSVRTTDISSIEFQTERALPTHTIGSQGSMRVCGGSSETPSSQVYVFS